MAQYDAYLDDHYHDGVEMDDQDIHVRHTFLFRRKKGNENDEDEEYSDI